MANDPVSESPKFLGLLECPLRRGYIEFEYQAGDKVAELKSKVSAVWGQPVALGDHLDHERWHGGFTDSGLWAVLCEDKSGAYVPLRDNSEIPHTPPEESPVLSRPKFGPNPDKRWNLPAGIIYDRDVEETIWPDEQIQQSETSKQTSPIPHINLALRREYKVPKHKKYSVKLLALVVIQGG